MNTQVLFVFIFAVIVICTIILDVNASNDNNICEGKKEKYTTGWWPWKRTKYRAGKMKCCDGYIGNPPDCLRKTAIAYKAVKIYKSIWTDKGSWYISDVSIWRPQDAQSGYYPLGDTVVATHSKPKEYSLVVKALERDALAEPERFKKIWNDKGSGANADVTIYEMIPKPGYTCLGHIAVKSYKTKPKISKYRCVNSTYVITEGSYSGIWKSKGIFENSKRVKLWLNSEINGLFANTFTAKLSYSKPKDKLYFLNSDHAKLHTFAIVENLKHQPALKVYAISNQNRASLIWTDNLIRANDDVSIYEAKKLDGYFSLGNIAEGRYKKPNFVFLVEPQKSKALKKPNAIRKLFEISAYSAMSFWKPTCPSGYEPLGHVASKEEPSLSDVMCVNEDYIIEGNWVKVWDTKGSTAIQDGTIFRAVSIIESGQGIHAMSTVRGILDKPDFPAYVLKSDSIEYIEGLPIKAYIITDVTYYKDEITLLDEASQELSSITVTNEGSTEQTQNRKIEYTTAQENNWSTTEGFQQGIAISVTAGVPDIFSASVEVSQSRTYEYQTGGSKTEEATHSIEVTATVQPRRKQRVSIISKTVIANIPYTATLVKVYADDSKSEEIKNFEGVYQYVQYSSIEVVYSKDIELD